MVLNNLQRFPDKQSWAKSVKRMLENLGYNHAWFSKDVCNIKVFMSILKQRLADIFFLNWNEQLLNSSRANTYKFISDIHFKTYLVYYCSKFRYALSRLRVSSRRFQSKPGDGTIYIKYNLKIGNGKYVLSWKNPFHLKMLFVC